MVLAPGFKFVDLFAGVGGFHHALGDPAFGGECELAVEVDNACRAVYQHAFPSTRIVPDIRSLTRRSPSPESPELTEREIDALVPDHDVLCGGFPCQPFSKSGQQQGIRDQTRGTLFFDVMSIVLAKRPKYVILENVRNLAGPRHVDTWATITSSLWEAGYSVAPEPVVVSPHLLPPSVGGAPQVRDRVFILAHRLDGGSWEDRIGSPLVERAPDPSWEPDRWRISDYLDPAAQIPEVERFRIRPEEEGWIQAWNAFVKDIPSDWLPGFPIWADEFKEVPEIPDECADWKRDFILKNSAFYRDNKREIDAWKSAVWGPLKQKVDEFPASRRKFEWQARRWQPRRTDRDLSGLVLHMRPSGIRVKPPTYLPALVAISQTSIVGPKVQPGSETKFRRITPAEAARLQGLPDTMFDGVGVSDADAYKQLGNAVNVGVVRYVAAALFNAGGDSWGSQQSAENAMLQAV